MTMKQRRKNILRWVLLAICGAVLGLNIYHMNSERLVHEQLPMPFGCGSAVVLSGSMEPELSRGDLIIVREAGEYDVNDVVVYQQDGILIVHRIIKVSDEEIITKGDANPVADQPISAEAIRGKVVMTVPLAGTLVNLLKTPFGTVCLIIAAILLVEIPRRREQKQADNEKQKIIDEIRKIRDEQK